MAFDAKEGIKKGTEALLQPQSVDGDEEGDPFVVLEQDDTELFLITVNIINTHLLLLSHISDYDMRKMQ